MKKSSLLLALICAPMAAIIAQKVEPSKYKYGVNLSTHVFGLNNNLTNVNVGGGFYISRKISKRLSIYLELNGSNREFRNLAITPDVSGEFITGNLATYFGPSVDVGKKSNVSFGFVHNELIKPELRASTNARDFWAEPKNYSSLFFDYRTIAYKDVVLGIRYEWGQISVFKNTDTKVNNISLNLFLPLKGR